MVRNKLMNPPAKDVETDGQIFTVNITGHPKDSEISVLREYVSKMNPIVC